MRIDLCITPEEGKWFRVIPKSINRQILEFQRTDSKQEIVRKAICQAVEEADFRPRTYRPFYTIYPKKTWDEMTMKEMLSMATNIGDGIMNFTMQALEWGQRLTNGETWQKVCNDADTAEYYRLIEWLTVGNYKRIGGAVALGDRSSPTCLLHFSCTESSTSIKDAVPAIYKVMHR